MVKDSDAALLKQLAAMVEDDFSIVTYKTLSRRLELSVNHAKRLLQTYASSSCRPDSVSVFYALFGSLTLDDGTVTQKVIVVPEKQVEERSRRLSNVSKHVYSVQAIESIDGLLLHMADSPVGPDDVRAIRASTSIECDHIKPRGKSSQESASKLNNISSITGQTLRKIETEQSKVMAGLGMSVTALKVKSSTPKNETINEPLPQEPKVKSGTVASWVKAGGLDPRKPSEIQKTVESNRRRPLSPRNQKKETSSDSEDDFFAPKKSGTKPARVLVDSDEEGNGVLEAELDSMDDVEMGDQTMHRCEEMEKERSPSPDQVTIIRRSVTKTSLKLKNDAGKIPKPSHRALKDSSTFGDFTQVSDNEEEAAAKLPTVKPAGRNRKNFVESDEEMERVEQVKPAKKSGKKTQPKEDMSDNEEDNKKTRKPRKKLKKELVAGDIYSEERQRSPSVERPEPLKQFLMTSSLQRERKLVTKTRVDAEGYTVMEKVWVNASDDEAENSSSIAPVARPVPSISKKPAPESIPKVQEDEAASLGAKNKSKGAGSGSQPGKGKTVQSSLMNFFKKA